MQRFDYSNLKDTGLRLIYRFGVPCEIVSKPTSGGFDPITGAPLDDMPATSQTAQCVLLDYSTEMRNRQDSLIESGDKKILIAAKGVTEPKLSDKITVGGKSYTVAEVTNLNPATIPLVYEVRGRE